MDASICYDFLVNKHSCYGTYAKPKEKEITILIPCWGKAEYIEETVKSCVNQTMKAYQIIVLLMDEESQKLKDKLENLCDNVKCIIHERLLISAARNYLVSICPTEYFFLLDADDTISPNALEECYKQKESVVIIPRDDLGRIIGACKQAAEFNLTGLWNKEIWNELGGLDENLNYFEDIDFRIKTIEQKKWDVGLAYKANYNYTKGAKNNSNTISTSEQRAKYARSVFNNRLFLEYPDTFSYDCGELNNMFLISCKNNIDFTKINLIGSNEINLISNKQKKIKLFFPKNIKINEGYIEPITYIIDSIDINKIGYSPKINIILGENATEWPPFFQEKIYNIIKSYKCCGIIFVETDGNNKKCVFYNRPDIILIRDYEKWNKNINFDDLQKNEIPRLKITNENIANLEDLLQKNEHIYFDCLFDMEDESIVNKLLELNKKYKKLIVKTQCTGDLLTIDFEKKEAFNCPYSSYRKNIDFKFLKTKKQMSDFYLKAICKKQCLNCIKNKYIDDDYLKDRFNCYKYIY